MSAPWPPVSSKTAATASVCFELIVSRRAQFAASCEAAGVDVDGDHLAAAGDAQGLNHQQADHAAADDDGPLAGLES